MVMAPFLTPIDKPNSLRMRIAFFFMRRLFGKAFTPMRVHSARLAHAFFAFYTRVYSLDRKLRLPRELALLIRQQVARINVCAFCKDSSRWAALLREHMNAAKFDVLQQYEMSTLFSDAERAALDYVSELTKHKKVDPNTFARLAAHFDEREICEIVWLAASEHLYNLSNLGLNIGSDGLCRIEA
jgi:alkylhydroperoxidase family enzyme